jgi:hypothetical protein
MCSQLVSCARCSRRGTFDGLDCCTLFFWLIYSLQFLGFRSGEHLRRIKELSISGCLNILPNQLLKATAVMVMIENLDISNCVQFDTEALLKIMSRLPLLEAINISNCTNVHGLIFDRLIEFPNLRKICSFSNQQIEFESVSRFLGSSTKIQHVSLSRSHIFKRMFSSMAVCTSLNFFDVSSCGLTIVSGCYISQYSAHGVICRMFLQFSWRKCQICAQFHAPTQNPNFQRMQTHFLPHYRTSIASTSVFARKMSTIRSIFVRYIVHTSPGG